MIVYRHYHNNHPMCGAIPPKNLPDSMKRFWKTRLLGESEYAVVAYENGKIIGFFKYYLTRSKRMNAYGTYVMPAYRKLGVAKRLWNIAIKKISPKKIRVYLTSKSGTKFLASMIEEHNKIEFLIRGKYNHTSYILRVLYF